MTSLSRTSRLFYNAHPIAIAFGTAWLLLALFHIGNPAQAAEPATSPAAQPPIVYRRVFVPADNVDAWPRDGEKYIPVESRDFDAWVAAANQAKAGRGSAATIDSAEYAATLDDDGRFHGRGQWIISLRGDKPAFLPLGHTSLVIRDPRWQSAAQQSVRLGMWGAAAGEPARFGLEIPRSGILEFEWTIPTQSQRDETEIPWRVPNAAASRLTLDLPNRKQPTVDGAAVLESTLLGTNAEPEDKRRRHWVLGLNSSPDSVLRIATDGREVVPPADQFTLREQTSYRIEQRGLEITSTWDLEGEASRQRELSIPLPRGAQITSVVAGNRESGWQITRGTAPTLDRAVIVLPAAAEHAALQLVVHAWYPLVLDKPWQLPILRPEGVIWSSGKLDLSVAPQFELKNLIPIECDQDGTNQIGPTATGPEVYSLLSYSPAATVEVAIMRRQPDATIRVGSSLVLADQDVTGRLVTEWNVTRSSVHRLSGELAAGWNVETVETIPTDAMAEWFIDRRGNRRQLEIQLTDSVSPARKVSVIVMGRLQRFSLAEPISADTLRMVNWSNARVARHLLTFQSSEPFTIESVGDLPVLTRDAITDADRSLLDTAIDDARTIDLAHAGPDAGLQLSFKRGAYKADIELEASYAGNELWQLYRITAQPQANAVDRLLVYSTAKLGNSTRWTEKSSAAALTAERLPADDPRFKNLPKEGELWMLRLPQPTTSAIEVAATVTTAWPKRASVPLLALPEAVEQSGRAYVRSNVNTTPEVEPIGFTPVPLPVGEHSAARSEDASPIRAAFRFNPAECLRQSQAPQLRISPGVDSGTSPLVARYLDLESYFWPDGRGAHRATYQLDNYGANEFKPVLPPEAKLTYVSVNGQAVGSPIPEGDVAAPVRLSPQSHTATIAFYFETQGAALSAGREVSPPLLQNGIPLLAGKWKVWLPEEFTAQTESPLANTQYDWQQRLFGPFARPSGSAAFHPLRLADWAHILNSFADWQSTPATESVQPFSAERVQPGLAAPIPTSVANETQNSAKEHVPDVSLPGWREYRETFIADGAPDPIVLQHPPARTAWAVAAFFAAFLFGHWLCRERSLLLIVLMAIAASAALFLPTAFAPLATGALWGLLCSKLAQWPRRLLTSENAANAGRGRIALAGIVAVAVACGIARIASAQPVLPQPPAQEASVTTQIERILIPVDAERRVAGTKYYLSERFLRELLEPAADRDQSAGDWLLLDATYTGDLAENRERADIVAVTWALKFSIETLTRNTTIVLPLVRDEATWQPTAMLDGVPAPLTWREPARSCAVDIEQPGRYSLTIYCVPKTTNTNGRSQLNLTIPPLLSAAVHVHAPATLKGVTLAGVRLAPAAKDATGVLNGELGQADHLAIEWPRLEPKSGASQGLTVTAMSWLHVGATTTELETKYIVEGGARRPEALTISYDDRWKLASGPQTPADKPESDVAGRHTIRVPLPAESGDRQELLLRWKLASVPTAGNFRLPPIELTSIPSTQHWFALSTEPALDCTVSDSASTGATSATGKEFLTKWGGSPAHATPQTVLANFDPSRVWTLAIRPHEVESTVHEVLHVAIGRQALRVVYQANVTPGSQNRYQYHLNVPANLIVDEITLNEADRKIATRWTRDAENHINVFFGDGATSNYRLSLSGSVPVDASKPIPLPRVAASGSAMATQQLQLYRDDDVRVELKGLPPAEESTAGPTDLPPVQWLVRPLGVYHPDQAAATGANIVVKPTEPKLKGDTLTTLARESGVWSATFRGHLSAAAGDCDVLRLRVPTSWSGPFDIESSVPVTTETTPLDEHRQIVALRFATTIAEGGHVNVRIRSPLMLPTGSAVSVPEIAVDPPADGHRYAIVPTSLDSQTIAWNGEGVRDASVPKILLAASTDVTKQRQLEITEPSFHVSVSTRAAKRPMPRIRLADIAVSYGRRGGQLIVTRLIVASDGVPECTLQLPDDQELVSVTLDGRPALKSAVDATHWHVALGAAQLPQSVEIVSRTSEGSSAVTLRELSRPTLLVGKKTMPVEVSLWSFARSDESDQVQGAAPVSAADQAALRLDRMVSIAEAAIATAAAAPSPDGKNWLRPWVALMQGVRDQTQQIMTQPAAASATAQVARSAEEQINKALKRLDLWLEQANTFLADGITPPSEKSAMAADAVIFASQFTTAPGATCYVAEGGADRLPISVAATSPTPRQTQLLALLTIALLAIGCGWLIGSPSASDFVCRWPHVFGVLIGIAWWAWLWPSWFGLVIVAVSVWLALRFDWPGRSIRAEASTVLRSTRSH